jgi:hypothetical protein
VYLFGAEARQRKFTRSEEHTNDGHLAQVLYCNPYSNPGIIWWYSAI